MHVGTNQTLGTFTLIGVMDMSTFVIITILYSNVVSIKTELTYICSSAIKSIPFRCNIIDSLSNAKLGDNAFGSICLSMCLCIMFMLSGLNLKGGSQNRGYIAHR